ncbi:hypothetical protein B0H11DRAFT_2228212 [Mycena galericulata]|nr:hypothetical protein B0H11DRAFT_2228212 [Mycena galericulata]
MLARRFSHFFSIAGCCRFFIAIAADEGLLGMFGPEYHQVYPRLLPENDGITFGTRTTYSVRRDGLLSRKSGNTEDDGGDDSGAAPEGN